MKTMKKVKITKVDTASKTASKTTDTVAEEKPLYIFLGKTHCVTIFCSPSNLKELAIGHLLSEGLVKTIAEIDKISLKDASTCRVTMKSSVNVEKRLKLLGPFSRVVLSACGSQTPLQFTGRLPVIKSELTVRADVIQQCVRRLNFDAETFRKTGGVHVAAIYEREGSRLCLAEDVGRHNAVDKVIGFAALNKIDLEQCFLAVSGRLTGDMVLKAARVAIPIVASLAAALDSGVTIAEKSHLTLIGFVRGNRMNVYTFPERILT